MNVLQFLALDVQDGEYITTVSNVSIGQSFRVGGTEYTKTRDIQGTKYNMHTHQEEQTIYNCKTIIANEYVDLQYLDPEMPVIAKEV